VKARVIEARNAGIDIAKEKEYLQAAKEAMPSDPEGL
jgi:hypothetical protein